MPETWKPGDIVVLTSGEYSDYTIRCLIRAVVKVDLSEVLERAKAEVGFDETWSGTSVRRISADAFGAWLERNGLAEIVEFHEWNADD